MWNGDFFIIFVEKKGEKLNRIKQKAKTPIHKMNSRKIFLLHNNLHT